MYSNTVHLCIGVMVFYTVKIVFSIAQHQPYTETYTPYRKLCAFLLYQNLTLFDL